MKWEIGFSRDAEKFMKRENLRSETVAEIINFLKRVKGESVSVDVKKLKGDWQGFYRIRKGKLRIISNSIFKSISYTLPESITEVRFTNKISRHLLLN